ncbi:MAG: transcription antitermination factor NusB [Bacteroidales bacterium]
MTNRVLIRNKILQIVFSAFIDRDKTIPQSESEYVYSMQKTYDLYVLLLFLMTKITDEYGERMDRHRTRHINPLQDKDINKRLVNNRFIAQLSTNKIVNSYIAKHGEINDILLPTLIKSLLDKIIESDTYSSYIENPKDDYETDKSFWKKVVREWGDETEIDEALEDGSLYWNNDIGIIVTFVEKTIKAFAIENGAEQKIIPTFDAEPDADFPGTLLRDTIIDFNANMQLIGSCANNWEIERIANMDFVIMCMALTEAKLFPSIPINVTLSEYIELAKSYSTDKSATFINGVLDTLMKNLKKEGKLTKE